MQGLEGRRSCDIGTGAFRTIGGERLNRFAGKVVAVTGASRGIGRETAARFAAEGASVALIATTAANAESAADEIRSVHPTATVKGYGCDVSQASQVETEFGAIEADLGTVGVLVNNAGITRDTLLMRMSEEDWDRVLEVNLKGAWLCTKAVLRGMLKARWGRIVNVTSIVGLGGAAGQANYAASKAGLIGLTKSTAKELGSRNITCNAVAPGFIETDMTAELSPEMREAVAKTAPLGRLGASSDIAGTVLYLASEDAGYVTGQVLTVDGGLTL